ncbi:hypothetical protein ABZ613_31395, partial [Streptomyces collinus]|uniref:hypothetical protein n=1 Tax=Streptomyces collinus TaxID=42684 RepID=UPI0033EB302E
MTTSDDNAHAFDRTPRQHRPPHGWATPPQAFARLDSIARCTVGPRPPQAFARLDSIARCTVGPRPPQAFARLDSIAR